MQFCKRDVIPKKIKNGGSDILCKYQHWFLVINCITNFIAIAFLEDIKKIL